MNEDQREAVYEAQKSKTSLGLEGPQRGMDPEFIAMDTCCAALNGLPIEARQRVLDYLVTRFKYAKPGAMQR